MQFSSFSLFFSIALKCAFTLLFYPLKYNICVISQCVIAVCIFFPSQWVHRFTALRSSIFSRSWIKRSIEAGSTNLIKKSYVAKFFSEKWEKTSPKVLWFFRHFCLSFDLSLWFCVWCKSHLQAKDKYLKFKKSWLQGCYSVKVLKVSSKIIVFAIRTRRDFTISFCLSLSVREKLTK